MVDCTVLAKATYGGFRFVWVQELVNRCIHPDVKLWFSIAVICKLWLCHVPIIAAAWASPAPLAADNKPLETYC